MVQSINKSLINIKYLSGFIFQKSHLNLVLHDVFIKHNSKTNSYSEISGPIKEIQDWYWGKIITKLPYKNESIEGPFSYNFFFKEKETASYTLILSENKEIAKLILDSVQVVDKNFLPIKISVKNILKQIKNPDLNKDGYFITYLHTKVSGMQDRINALAFYGRDVIRGSLYEKYQESFDPFSCGIGVEDNSFSSGYGEIVRVTNDGHISFNCRTVEVFKRIKEMVIFIRNTDSLLINDGQERQ